MVGAFIGAEMHVTIEPLSVSVSRVIKGQQTWTTEMFPWPDKPSSGDGSAENAMAAQAASCLKHAILCDGFGLRIVQRGGPPIDPSKFHGQCKEEVIRELERWANRNLAKRPSTWRTLSVCTKQSSSVPKSIEPVRNGWSSVLDQPLFGQRPSDIMLAATIITDVTLEPFELSYGDAHIRQVRRMLEDEVAAILQIKPSQVLCSDLEKKGRGSRQRHVRRDTVTFRIAILHEELANSRDESAKVPFGNLLSMRDSSRNSTPPASKSVSLPSIGNINEDLTILSKIQARALDEAGRTVEDAKKDSMTVALKQTMEAALARSELEKVEDNLRKARGAKKLKFESTSLTQKNTQCCRSGRPTMGSMIAPC